MTVYTEERYFRNPVLPYKKYQRITYKPGKVARIILNRPRYLNALSHALWGELEDALDRACDDPECRVIVISGAGRCFSAGDDTIGLSPEGAPCLVTDETPEELMKRLGSEEALWHQYNIEHDYYPLGYASRLWHIPKPTIAMVHGYCIFAAFMLATSMDLIFASEDALFLPTGTTRTMWDLGPRKVLELAYEHRFLTAREAFEYHMVSRIYPTREILEKETLAFANRVANQAPNALRRTKEAFLRVMDMRGLTESYEATRTASWQLWRQWAEDGHPEREEGKGIARTPIALSNLKTKLESEGAKVPEHVLAALARAAARDDKATWQRALHQEWREKERQARADAGAKTDAENIKKKRAKSLKVKA